MRSLSYHGMSKLGFAGSRNLSLSSYAFFVFVALPFAAVAPAAAAFFFFGILISESFVTSSWSSFSFSSSASSGTSLSTSKASSISGAGPPAASFLGALPRSVALWNGIGCSAALYLRVNADLACEVIFLRTCSSWFAPTPSSMIVSHSSFDRK